MRVCRGRRLSLLLLLAVGCTTTTKVVETAPPAGGTADAGGGGGGPAIDAAQVGQACSGYGTGLGETAAFQTEDCPAGVCLVDARTGLALYCSADCTNATCPDGWECLDTDHGVAKACFKTPGTESGDAATASPFDAPLTGYRASAKASTTFPISGLKDPSKIAIDLVVLVVDARWAPVDNKLLQDLQTGTVTRALMVSVLVDGASQGKAATKTDLDAWHGDYPKTTMVLDGALAKLGPAIGALGAKAGEIRAFPTIIALDAYTLDEIGRTEGYTSLGDLQKTVDAWRAKTK